MIDRSKTGKTQLASPHLAHGSLKIYGDMISPYVRACIVTAHEAGLGDNVQLIQTDVAMAAANEDLAVLSPIAQIPVLVTPQGVAIHDSRVIVDYLCFVGDRTLMPTDGDERYRVLTLQAIGQGIADAAVSYRNEKAQRPTGLHWIAWLDRLKLRVEFALDALEASWQRDLGHLSAGSITVAVVLSYLDYRFDDWTWRSERAKLAAFHNRFSVRHSMQVTALGAPSAG